MSFTSITKPTQGDATKKSLADAIIDDLNDCNERLLAIGTITGLKNGSFESDSDSDGTPDSWTKTLYSGGSFTLDQTDQQHSLTAAKFTSPGGGGNGGGYLDTTDFLEVSPNRTYQVLWEMKSSIATVSNKVEVTYYTAAQVSISTTSLYSESAANPTSWAARSASFTPPATARYAKLRFTGGHTSSTVAGSTWFDNLFLRIPDSSIPTMEVITTTGTWTAPVGVGRVRVRAWGGGAGGGNTTRGGGSGAYGEECLSVTAGTGYTVTIGAGGAGAAGSSSANGSNGGNTSFGSLLTANGGTGAGAGGTSTAAFNITGTATDAGQQAGGSAPHGGSGGIAAAAAGVEPGGGGAMSTGATTGGAGAKGRVIVEY